MASGLLTEETTLGELLMPEMTDIDEIESNEEQNDNEQKEQKPDTNAAMLAALDKLNRTVSSMNVPAAAAAKDSKKDDVDPFELAIQTMVGKGYDKSQLEDLVALHLASKDSLEKTLRKEQEKQAAAANSNTLNKDCFNRADEALDAMADIKMPRVRQGYIQEVYDLMNSHDDFANARAAYERGVAPSKSDFEKAVRMVLQSAPKEIVRTKSDTKQGTKIPAQLDTGNSRPTQSKAIGKDGKVNLEKLDDVERDIYTRTLNITKNPEIALKALKEIAPIYER